jgi:hypothetical protein
VSFDVLPISTQIENGNSGSCCGHVILKAVCKLGRRQVAERAVGSVRIVVTPPRFDDRPRVVERQELMHVEAFIAQAPIEGFDMPVVRRLARAREIDFDATVKRPRFDGVGGELGAVIHGDRFR